MDAYFDIFSGISGNMVLGALIDAGLSLEILKKELSKLGMDEEYRIESKKVLKNGISATYVNMELKKHEHTHRSLRDIQELIDKSSISKNVKEKSKNIFFQLAKAESKIHGVDINEIHFHEVGATDAIVDIVGSVIGMELLSIERIKASPIHVGNGFVESAHGKIPVPAPATMELLKGIPIYSIGIKSELTTPTGAAIISTLAEDFGPRPEMQISSTSYGAGTRDLKIPNLLRLNLGEFVESNFKMDFVDVVEANIDDLNPQFYDYVMEKLFEAGALDVFLTPIQMKKNRPASRITVLVTDELLEEIVKILLTETTTLGVRVTRKIQRYCLERESKIVETKWGKIRIKIAKDRDSILNISPEYEDCRKVSLENNIPLKVVYNSALKACIEEME